MRARLLLVALLPLAVACVPDYQFGGQGNADGGADVTERDAEPRDATAETALDAVADGAGPTLRTGLVLLLHMDEAAWSGAGSVKDDSGQGNDGTPEGTATTTADGKFGRAASLDGAGFVRIADAPSLHPATALTCAAWVYPTALGRFDGGDDYPGILSKRADYGVDVAFTMFVWTGDALWADLQGSRFSSNATLANGRWTHVAVVYDGTVADGTMRARMYVDGKLDSVHPADPSLSAHAADLLVGYLSQGTRDPDVKAYFTGRIDEVAIWSRALASDEIAQLHDAAGPL